MWLPGLREGKLVKDGQKLYFHIKYGRVRDVMYNIRTIVNAAKCYIEKLLRIEKEENKLTVI